MDVCTWQLSYDIVWTFEKTPWHSLKFLFLLSRLMLFLILHPRRKVNKGIFLLSATFPDIKESNAQLISYTNMLLVIRAVSLLRNKLRVDFQRLHTTKTRCFSDKDTHRWDSWLFVQCILSQSPEKPLPLKLKRKTNNCIGKIMMFLDFFLWTNCIRILTDFRTYLCFFFFFLNHCISLDRNSIWKLIQSC